MVAADDGAGALARALRQRGGDAEPADVRPRRDERHVEERRQQPCRESRPGRRPPTGRPARSATSRATGSSTPALGLEHEPGVRQVHLVAADRRRDVAGERAHAVALVARPVGQREVADAAAAASRRPTRRAGRSRRPAGTRTKRAGDRVVAGEPEQRREPGRRPGRTADARTRKPPRITAIRIQLRISSVRSMRRPTSRIATQSRKVPTPIR